MLIQQKLRIKCSSDTICSGRHQNDVWPTCCASEAIFESVGSAKTQQISDAVPVPRVLHGCYSRPTNAAAALWSSDGGAVETEGGRLCSVRCSSADSHARCTGEGFVTTQSAAVRCAQILRDSTSVVTFRESFLSPEMFHEIFHNFTMF